MRVAITGSSGLIGSALTASLLEDGHEVTHIVRRPARAPDEVAWDPLGGTIDTAGLEGHDAVVNLAGEPVAGRWTERKRARIRDSRVVGTEVLSQALARLSKRPSVLVSSSASGFYGDRGDEILDDDARPGEGFLADVCREWEAATQPADAAGIRVVHIRPGMVLSTRGGALPRLLTPLRFGLGGRTGSGLQWWPWISIDDHVGATRHLIDHGEATGAVNLVAPHAARNREFVTTLGEILRRPTPFPLPRAMVELMFGQMGREVLLASQRLVPRRLEKMGYAFQQPGLPGAIRRELGR